MADEKKIEVSAKDFDKALHELVAGIDHLQKVANEIQTAYKDFLHGVKDNEE